MAENANLDGIGARENAPLSSYLRREALQSDREGWKVFTTDEGETDERPCAPDVSVLKQIRNFLKDNRKSERKEESVDDSENFRVEYPYYADENKSKTSDDNEKGAVETDCFHASVDLNRTDAEKAKARANSESVVAANRKEDVSRPAGVQSVEGKNQDAESSAPSKDDAPESGFTEALDASESAPLQVVARNAVSDGELERKNTFIDESRDSERTGSPEPVVPSVCEFSAEELVGDSFRRISRAGDEKKDGGAPDKVVSMSEPGVAPDNPEKASVHVKNVETPSPDYSSNSRAVATRVARFRREEKRPLAILRRFIEVATKREEERSAQEARFGDADDNPTITGDDSQNADDVSAANPAISFEFVVAPPRFGNNLNVLPTSFVIGGGESASR